MVNGTRSSYYRLKTNHYKDALEYFKESRIQFEDHVPDLPPLEQLKSNVELRTYQNKALDKWRHAGNRGVIVLPTAAGKTFIA
jgi:superfamily II DNA or RNA helicase